MWRKISGKESDIHMDTVTQIVQEGTFFELCFSERSNNVQHIPEEREHMATPKIEEMALY